MDRQTLRDWVIRYNEAGVAGLVDRPRSGRPPRLNDAQMAELDRLVEAGPDVAVHGVVRWRCVHLQARIKARFDVEGEIRTAPPHSRARAISVQSR